MSALHKVDHIPEYYYGNKYYALYELFTHYPTAPTLFFGPFTVWAWVTESALEFMKDLIILANA